MPPKKKYAKTVSVGLTQFEAALLDHLVATCRGSYASHLREALWVYGRVIEASQKESFRAAVEHGVAPTLAANDRRTLLGDLDRFLEQVHWVPPKVAPAKHDDLAGVKLKPFRLSREDFED